MRRLIVPLLCVLAGCASSSEQTESTGSSTATVERISIMTRTVWEVVVYPDGSGRVSFAASASPDSMGRFRKGTLEFAEVRTALSADPDKTAVPKTQVDVVLWRPGQTSAKAQQCYVSLPWVEALFKKALASVESKPPLLQRYEKEKPMFPHNKEPEATR